MPAAPSLQTRPLPLEQASYISQSQESEILKGSSLSLRLGWESWASEGVHSQHECGHHSLSSQGGWEMPRETEGDM